MRVAVLGMGRMGHEVAGRLLSGGHEVAVWNRSAGKADDLVAAGAKKAESAEAAVASAEAVISSLADDGAVLSVMAGDEPLAARLPGEAVYLDMSTVAPETSRRLSQLSSCSFLAAPIIGAPMAVATGGATYLVSGAEEAFEKVGALYASLAEQVRYLGEEVELAPRLKLLANTLLLTGLAALAEVVSAAQAVGFDDAAMRAFVESSPLVAPGLSNRIEALFTGQHSGWFTTALGAKDLRLADEMVKRARLSLPLLELVKDRYEEAAATGHGEQDLTAIVELSRPK